MKSLEEFLSLPDVSDITEDVFVSKRLGTFKVRAMTNEEYKDYQKDATRKTKDTSEIDANRFSLLIIAGQTVSPKFNDAELLKKAGCTTASELIEKKLLSGEISKLADRIVEISGFGQNPEQDIEEAKN